MKKLRIGLGTPDDFFAQGKRIARAADRGESIAETFSVEFEDPEDLVQLLTRARLGVFRTVKAEPASVSAIARRLHRDRSAVKRDVDVLRDAGLVIVENMPNPGRGAREIVRATAAHVELRARIV
ncbi:helix-turn-helix domain-containing protein [Paraburkholderia ferrariae]|uniref:Helix-turn-helix domain-containing protein n=1 Tax=Paraburkholderia ferrariae TaxID=386056 RepID=A0ABU9S392_9BURK